MKLISSLKFKLNICLILFALGRHQINCDSYENQEINGKFNYKYSLYLIPRGLLFSDNLNTSFCFLGQLMTMFFFNIFNYNFPH